MDDKKIIISLMDGVNVEIDIPKSEDLTNIDDNKGSHKEKLADRNYAKFSQVATKEGYPKLNLNFKSLIEASAKKVINSFGDIIEEINTENAGKGRKLNIDSTALELSFSFGVDGSVYIANAESKGSLKLTVNWKLKEQK